MNRHVLASLAAIAVLASTARPATAFCGFYVGGADTELYNHATMVVLMRNGTRTVLSMRNNYQGPPSDFAMVVPVPVVLQKENVKTISPAVFSKVDRLAAPRLVEYWEQDPCPKPRGIGKGRYGGTATAELSARKNLGRSEGAKPTVKIEAQFVVGEYEVVVLSASDAAALEKWILGNGYKIPPGSAAYFRPYIQQGSKFFVAKVNPKKVTFAKGMAMLSPLRFHYDSKKFALPVRLGLINARGAQDLIVHIIAKGMRYEVANYPNVAIPTNLLVANDVRNKFGAFYAALFDATREKNPRAVITEYAWDSSTCDPCPSPPLSLRELETLGLDVVEPAPNPPKMRAIVRPLNPKVTGSIDRQAMRRFMARKYRGMRGCYEASMAKNPTLGGRLMVRFEITNGGAVRNAKVGSLGDPSLQSCVTNVVRAMKFPKAARGKGTGPATVSIPVMFRQVPIGRSAAARGWVLTRLHARYDKKSLGEDLVFREAQPIRGGQGGGGDNIQRGSMTASRNTFQGRYIMRHEWTGPMTCKTPRRGRWGGPPRGVRGSTSPTPALNLAFAPRTGLTLTKLVRGAAIDFSGKPMTPSAKKPRAGANTPPRPKPEPTVDPKDKGEGRPGCGCGTSDGPGAVFATWLGLLLLLRRRAKVTLPR